MAIPRTFRALSCANTSITTLASFPARSSELMGGKLVSNCMSTILPRTDTIVPTPAGAVELGMRFTDEASTAGRVLVPNGRLCTALNIESRAVAARRQRLPGFTALQCGDATSSNGKDDCAACAAWVRQRELGAAVAVIARAIVGQVLSAPAHSRRWE